MTVFAVYETASGNLKSVGTVVADPLPAGLTSVALSTPDAQSLSNGTGRWDPATRTVVAVTPSVQEVNKDTIRTRLNQARTANNNYLALAAPTNPQAVAYLDTVAKELNGICDLIEAEWFGNPSALDDISDSA